MLSSGKTFWVVFIIVSAYGEVLEKTSKMGIVHAESLLPRPKKSIRKAIKQLLLFLRNKDCRSALRKMRIPKGTSPELVEYVLTDEYYESLRTGYVLLARFVPDNDAHVFAKFWELVEQPSEQPTEQLLTGKSNFLELSEKATEILRRSRNESKALLEEIQRIEKNA